MNEILSDDFAISGSDFQHKGAKRRKIGQTQFEEMGMRDLTMRESDWNTAASEVAVNVATSIHPAKQPMERNTLAFDRGEMCGGDLQPGDVAGREPLDGRSVDGQGVAFVNDSRVEAELFRRAVVIEKAVVFPFDVVEFGINVGGDLLMAAEFVGEELEAPAYVLVAVESANAAIFAIDERLPFMEKTRDVVEGGADESRLDDFIDVGFGLRVIVNVEVPGVYVGVAMLVIFEMFPVTNAHVFDQASGIEAFGEFPHFLDPDFRSRERNGRRRARLRLGFGDNGDSTAGFGGSFGSPG